MIEPDKVEDVTAFVQAAREYVSHLDRVSEYSAEGFLQELLRLLPMLYVAALNLPETEPATDTLANEGRDDMTRYSKVALAVGERVGPRNVYWEVYDPYEEGGLVAGSLGDDLSDIYGDIVDGLIEYEKGGDASTRDAVWHWRFSFTTHWGDHLTDTLRALHRIRYWRGFAE